MIRADGQKLFARNLLAVGEVCAASNGIGLVPSGNEGAVGLMENELVDGAVGAAAKRHAEPLQLDDGEDAALVGPEMVQGLIVRFERQLAVGILRYHVGHSSIFVTAHTGF